MLLAISVLLISLSALFPLESVAGTYWVSPTGAAAWGACNGETALSGTSACSATTAFANAAAGDVVYFRGGEYRTPSRTSGSGNSGYYNPTNSGTGDADSQRIIFRAYSRIIMTEPRAVFNGTKGGSADGVGNCFANIMATSGKDYITIDGFTFISDDGRWMARVFLGGLDGSDYSNYINFTNNIMDGGYYGCNVADNEEGLRVNTSNYVNVSHNVFQNYRSRWEGGASLGGTTATKCYTCNYTTYDGNFFQNNTVAMYDKDRGDHTTVRNSFFVNSDVCYQASDNTHFQINGTLSNNVCYSSLYRGLSASTNGQAVDSYLNDWTINNNTIYTTRTQAQTLGNGNEITKQQSLTFKSTMADGAQRASIYNNIVQGPTTGNEYSGSVRFAEQITNGITNTIINDYNNYGSPMAVIGPTNGSVSSTIASLQAKTIMALTTGNHNQSSIASAPSFVNATGGYYLPSDFKLTGGSAGTNAGNDGHDMGANTDSVWHPTPFRKPMTEALRVAKTALAP